MATRADGDEGQKDVAKSAPRDWSIGRKAILAIAVVAIVVIASAVVLSTGSKPEEKGNPSAAGSVTDVNMTSVGIPLTEISQSAKWFEYNVSGSTVRFFVVMDGNGAIHTAFDECWMCFNAHLGYRQNGTSMIENCCNMSFPISDITEQGCSGDGCCPIFLPSKVIGDQLSIRKSDLAKQKLIFISTNEAGNVHAYNSTHVAISLSLVGENATWYQYEINNTKVRFFAVTDVNGTVHTALDTCWKCYPKHQGFRQYGPGMMVENCCNMAFSVTNITAVGCSIPKCHPVFLANQVIGGEVVVAISDLLAGSYMFAD